VQDFDLAPVEPSKYGQFFGGDSYVIQYTYLKNKIENYIIYFWLGDKSSADEKGSAALLAKQKDDSLRNRPVLVRVVQGKEPAHFRQLFKGKLVIHTGGRASCFKNVSDSDSYDTDGTALFHVKGTNDLNTVAVQVTEVASSLNSEDCFVLVTPSHAYAWNGRASNSAEKATALSIAQLLSTSYNGTGGRVVEAVNEGSEPANFWSAIGGKTDYASISPGETAPKDPRLFQASNATGSFDVNEVCDFTQTDLNDEDVFLLDTYTAVYLWIGSQSNEAEKTKSFEFANKFIAEANDGRDPDCPIITVHAGQEPAMFTAQFVGWDENYYASIAFQDPYTASVQTLIKSTSVTDTGAATTSQPSTAKNNVANTTVVPKLPLPASTTTTTNTTTSSPPRSVNTGTEPTVQSGGGCGCVIS
jgi:hypothetical protein